MADIVIKEWELPPYPGDQAPPHVHYNSDEAFYVLDGEMEVLLGDQRHRNPAGTLVMVPSGIGTPLPITGLGTFACWGHGPEVDELIAELHRADSAHARDAFWARYHSAVLQVSPGHSQPFTTAAARPPPPTRLATTTRRTRPALWAATEVPRT